MKKLCMAILASLALAVPASAAPNWLGMTGLMRIPTADALNGRDFNVSYHYISDNTNDAAGNIGLTRGLELGVVYYSKPHSGSTVTGQFKYQLMRETRNTFSLAGGWWDFVNGFNSTPYGVITKTLTEVDGRPLRVHLGGGGGIYENIIFAGADLPLANNLLAMLEYDSNDINGGVRLALPEGFRLDVGLVSADFGVGASYNSKF